MPVTTRSASKLLETKAETDFSVHVDLFWDAHFHHVDSLDAWEVDPLRRFSTFAEKYWKEDGKRYSGFYYTLNSELYTAVSDGNKPLHFAKKDDADLPLFDPAAGWTAAPDDLYNDSVYIKEQFSDIFNEPAPVGGGDALPYARMMNEVRVLERLSRHPHPHIVRYLGCRVTRGRITGIVLEKVPLCLGAYNADKPEFKDLDLDLFLDRLESTVAFLHSLGLAHNEIKPSNVMIRDGLPVLIDFEGCCPLGGKLDAHAQGTPEWFEDGPWTTSCKDNDLYGLRLIRERIRDKDAVRRWFRGWRTA